MASSAVIICSKNSYKGILYAIYHRQDRIHPVCFELVRHVLDVGTHVGRLTRINARFTTSPREPCIDGLVHSITGLTLCCFCSFKIYIELFIHFCTKCQVFFSGDKDAEILHAKYSC